MRFPDKHHSLLAGDVQEGRVDLIIGPAGTVERRLCSHNLSLSRPLYPEGDLPHIFLINTSGGLVQGDRLNVGIKVKDDGRAHLTTQSANRIYRMEAGCAVQQTELAVGERAFLEYLPEPNIPYKGSRLVQLTKIDLRLSSTFFGQDIMLPGRYASGEEFECDLYHSGTEILIDGKTALIDTIILEPGLRTAEKPGIMGCHRFMANLYVYMQDYSVLSDMLGDTPHCITPKGVLLVRMIDEDWLTLKDKIERVWGCFRIASGMPEPSYRKG